MVRDGSQVWVQHTGEVWPQTTNCLHRVMYNCPVLPAFCFPCGIPSSDEKYTMTRIRHIESLVVNLLYPFFFFFFFFFFKGISIYLYLVSFSTPKWLSKSPLKSRTYIYMLYFIYIHIAYTFDAVAFDVLATQYYLFMKHSGSRMVRSYLLLIAANVITINFKLTGCCMIMSLLIAHEIGYPLE